MDIQPRFTIQEQHGVRVVHGLSETVTRYRVLDGPHLTKARFHTRAEAEAWVDEQRRRAILQIIDPQSSMPSRARAHLLTVDTTAALQRSSLPNAGIPYAPSGRYAD